MAVVGYGLFRCRRENWPGALAEVMLGEVQAQWDDAA